MPIDTSKYLKGADIKVTQGSSSPSANGGYVPPPKGSGSSILTEELQRAKTRIILTRLLDDGLQTLGQMEILDANGSLMFKMPTVELPYRNNQNGISCIPPGKCLVRPYFSEKYQKCFWVYSNEASNWQKNSIVGSGYNRTAVLIHRAPNSSWLMGCIGPGLKFNNEQLGKYRLNKTKYDPNHLSGGEKGNPIGTGTRNYAGTNKLASAGLWSNEGKASDNSFYMLVQNNPAGLLKGTNNASKVMNIKTGEPIFISSTT
tara:strand:- start:178 stop:954 length:777 start_codon:yes stop_codon:yes gene_type:complete